MHVSSTFRKSAINFITGRFFSRCENASLIFPIIMYDGMALCFTHVHHANPSLLSCLLVTLGLDDDSDTSSVCSISTCPGDLDFRRNTLYRPKMPTFPDIDQGAVSDQPQSFSSVQNQSQKTQKKSSNKQNYGIRPRPSGIHSPYLLCPYRQRQQPCFQGKLCKFAHSEEERKAWEEERKKGI